MTDKKAELFDWLQTALELELATIPPYLVALLSIKPPSNRAAAELIRSVAMEEMLHLALMANVMNAVGAVPRIGKDNVPSFPLQMHFKGTPFADRQFPINLAPFSEDSIKTFMKIEMPHQVAAGANLLAERIDVPALTIGDFYHGIVDRLTELDAAGDLFVKDHSLQLGEDFYWSSGGRIVRVVDLQSAKDALTIVITQGEGAWPITTEALAAAAAEPFSIGHYYRFSEIYHGHYYLPGDDPDGEPTGEAIAVDYAQVQPIKTNAKASDYAVGSPAATLNNAFNREYTLMLRQIDDAFKGRSNSLYTATMNGMHQLSSIARQLMALQLSGTAEHACPTFEWV